MVNNGFKATECPHGVSNPLDCYKCFPALHTYLAIFYDAPLKDGELDEEHAEVLGRERFTAKGANEAFNRAMQIAKAKKYYAPRCNYFGVYKLIRHVGLE